MSKNYTVIDVVFVDDDKTFEMIKIDALQINGNKIGERFTSLIKPHCSYPKEQKFGREGNIGSAALEEAPEISVVLKQLNHFIGDSEIVVYYDEYSFILSESVGVEFPVGARTIKGDAQLKFGDLQRDFTLEQLAEYFHLEYETCDVELMARIFLELNNCRRSPKRNAQKDFCFTPLYRRLLSCQADESYNSQTRMCAELESKPCNKLNSTKRL